MAYPVFQFTLSQLAAATAKRIDSGVSGRTQLWIANADAATVYVGNDNSVTNLTGYPVAAGATWGPLNVGFDVTRLYPQFWAYSVGGTGAGAVRVVENGGPL